MSVATVSKVINDRWGVAETTLGTGPGRDRGARLPVEPRRAEPAQPQHERDRGARRRHRAVQRRAAEGRRAARSTAPATSSSSSPVCGRANDQVGWERRYLARVSGTLVRRRTPRHPEQRRRDVRRARRRRRSQRRLIRASPPSIRQPEAAPCSRPSICSSLGTGGSASSPGGPTSSRHGSASAATAPPSERPGIEVDPSLIRVGGYQVDTAVEADATDARAGRSTRRRSSPPTTSRRLRRCSVARSLGLAVPDDLSVIGFDNVPESALSEPPLTTIEQPIQQMGFDAAKILDPPDRRDEPVPDHTLLPTRLVVRGSCRPLEACDGDGRRARRAAVSRHVASRATSASRIFSGA